MSETYPAEVLGIFVINRSENAQSVELWARSNFESASGSSSAAGEVAMFSEYVKYITSERALNQMRAKIAQSGITFKLAVVNLRYKNFSPERHFLLGDEGFSELSESEYKTLLETHFQ